jgi:mRNA interferase MazF
LPLRIVVPITNWQASFAKYPWIIPLPASATNGLAKDSAADTFQVKSVSERRFVQLVGVLDPQQIDEIATSIAVCVGAP